MAGASGPPGVGAGTGFATTGPGGMGGPTGGVPQATSIPTIHRAATNRVNRIMVLILLEALLALALLVGIVWWTMFSGRRGGEPPAAPEEDKPENPGKNGP